MPKIRKFPKSKEWLREEREWKFIENKYNRYITHIKKAQSITQHFKEIHIFADSVYLVGNDDLAFITFGELNIIVDSMINIFKNTKYVIIGNIHLTPKRTLEIRLRAT